MAKSENMMTQIVLRSPVEESDESYQLTTWVESDKRIKKGARLKLKDDDKVWTVDAVFDVEIPFSQIDHHGWDNNNYDKHEGLKLS